MAPSVSSSVARPVAGCQSRSSLRLAAPRAAPRSHNPFCAAAVGRSHESRRVASAAVETDVTDQVVATENSYVLQTYGRPSDLVFTRGEGCYLYSADGRKFLDFAAGIAVNSIGHGHPHWVAAVKAQAEALVHTSNLFHTEPHATLAKRLCEGSFADKVFYCNSGTEANEGAIKFARKWARLNAGLDPYEVGVEGPTELVSFHKCFHGRTMGALALTYKEQYKTPFMPVMTGAKMATYMDLESAASVIQKGKTAAVFVEPIQGEGGINIPTGEFLKGLRKLCDDAGALLVYDEVQCGLGRTGKMWAHQNFGVEPDMMSVAKPLAGGLPIGAVLMKQHVADAMAPGDHGSTFAGAPLVCAAANATLDIIEAPGFMDEVVEKGKRLREGLAAALEGVPHVVEVRGTGLMCGVELDVPAGPVTAACMEDGLIVITAGTGNVVRMVPPLVITNEQVDECIQVLTKAIKAL